MRNEGTVQMGFACRTAAKNGQNQEIDIEVQKIKMVHAKHYQSMSYGATPG
jgi:hypothetical protein